MSALEFIEIASDEVGIVLKKSGSKLATGKLIALNGEAGYQADVLTPERHFGFFPWQYQVRIEKAIQIPQGEIGLVIAKDGQRIPTGRRLGRVVECNDFQDARALLKSMNGAIAPSSAMMPQDG